MMAHLKTAIALRCRRHGAAFSTCVLLLVISAGLVGLIGLGAAGFRLNLTPSEPIGLWRILPQDRPIAIGDLVFVCPPDIDRMREAYERGYLHDGPCAGGFAPLIKRIAATSGQGIEVGDLVRIDGRILAKSRLMATDGQGRPILPYRGGVIPTGYVYLHSDFAASFDSRYFGPVPMNGILGFAQEVWTYAP